MYSILPAQIQCRAAPRCVNGVHDAVERHDGILANREHSDVIDDVKVGQYRRKQD
jgi:hypothetical protein